MLSAMRAVETCGVSAKAVALRARAAAAPNSRCFIDTSYVTKFGSATLSADLRRGLAEIVAPRAFATSRARESRIEDQLVQGERIVAHPHAAGVVDRVGDRRAGAADPELADPLRLQGVGLVVQLRQEHRLDVGDV